MSIKNIYQAESWTKIYQAFSQINFTAYDYSTIKLSIIDYIRIYFPESFNDFIESSELITLIESFAYVAEQLAYRVDMLSHENFISTAQRKQSILKLAKLISYSPSRNIPARGLVKITSISTTERVIDSQGVNLAGLNIIWNDPNSPLWKERFFLVMNRCLTGSFGQFASLQQIGDVSMQLYTFNHSLNTIPNGVFSFNVDTGIETFPMELVPVLLDTNGPYEKTPDVNSQLSVIYSNDGLGDGSDYTGFLMYAKQGVLSRLEYSMNEAIPNRTLSLAPINVNDTDVWVTNVSSSGAIEEIWEEVETLADQNLSFNIIKNRKKFEVETLENDAVKLIFGDGDFSDIPVGRFFFWLRQSANRSIVIPTNRLINQPLAFQYVSPTTGMAETCGMTFSLTTTIQNSAASESIEHIRQSAPSTYYAQNRMVNAQDYNTYMLKDQSILRLTSVNRTFAGQPKYIEWNDASGQYQNIKLFGDDLTIDLALGINSLSTGTGTSSRGLIDEIIEPLLSSTGIINTLAHISATDPLTSGMVSLTRRQFIEDNRQLYWNALGQRSALQEKTMIQGAIDQHWYGEPIDFVTIGGISYARIQDPGLHPEDDGKIWLNTVARTIDGVNPYIPGDVGSGLQSVAWQSQFGLAFNRHTPIVGTDLTLTGQLTSRVLVDALTYGAEVITIEVAANSSLLHVSSNLRGYIGTGEVNLPFTSDVIDFSLSQLSTASYALMPGDALKISYSLDLITDVGTGPYPFTLASSNVSSMNLLGRWEIIDGIDLTSANTVNPNTLPYDPTLYTSPGVRNPNSWLIWVKATLNPITQLPTSFTVNFRELKLQVSSANTKFWYNSGVQIIDSQTKNRVYDTIRVLRSNLKPDGRPLGHNENYDVVGPIVDSNGTVNLHALEVIPSDMLNIDTSGNTLPDSILQFAEFSEAASNESNYYEYFQLDSSGIKVPGTEIAASNVSFDVATYFAPGSFTSNAKIGGVYYGRTLKRTTLDFMWQHFTPYENLIDPSVSNIHDTYVLTQGYYNSISNYVQGRTAVLPIPPTPLELRNQFADLLDNKMLSDTVVLHPGKIKLLFGALAEPQFRAKFKLVKSSSASLSDEKLKIEVLSVINSYFGIENWDFGETFYATELFSLIHQRLPTEIASVVLVPIYSVNSFGSLFTVSSGLDEILQSAAQLSDIEIVAEFNASVLRQGGLS